MITRFKIFENVQYSKKVLSELDIDLNNENYLKLRDLLKSNLGYLGKFTEWMFKDKTPFDQLESLYNDLSNVKLDKPIDSFKDPEELYDYITSFKINRKINQAIKSLPSKTRRLVNQNLKDLINNNIKYANNIRGFYSKKGGRYKDVNTLINDTKSLIKNLSGGWSVDSIKYNKEELVYKDEFTLILHINSYERSEELGSSHWCISTNKHQWENYVSDFNKQYFIYDFTKDISDKKSMIGVTINISGRIKSTHYRDDSKSDKKEIMSEYGEYLTPYPKEYIKSKINIDNINVVSKYGLVEEVKRLIKKGIDPSGDNNSAIRWASYNGHIEVVKLLLQDPRVDPSDGDNYAIRYASSNGYTEVVKLLLQDPRVDPSDRNNYAIQYASQYGHTEVVKTLLQDPRVDPSADNNYAIRWASYNGHTEVVKLLKNII
jgi:hypothetical protein